MISGSPQFRILESSDENAPVYVFYEQGDLEEDLARIESDCGTRRRFRTFDDVRVVHDGEVVFSLISGRASIVRRTHEGFLLTQNYVTIVPSKTINPHYLVYLLNESPQIRRQLRVGLQGSQVLKYTIRQLKFLSLAALPTMHKQELIGSLYFDQLHLTALKHRSAENATTLVLCSMREVVER